MSPRRGGSTSRYASFSGAEYGYYQSGAKRIVLKTHDQLTFFHDLAHVAHDRIERLRPGHSRFKRSLPKPPVPPYALFMASSRAFSRWPAATSLPTPACRSPRCPKHKAVFSCLSEIQKVLHLILSSLKYSSELEEPQGFLC
jgi:hypothetical protein